MAHFKDYNDVVGDSPIQPGRHVDGPQRVCTHRRRKYKAWLLELWTAWLERTAANGGITPSNIGLERRHRRRRRWQVVRRRLRLGLYRGSAAKR